MQLSESLFYSSKDVYDMFRERFGENAMQFLDVFNTQSRIKYPENPLQHADEFISMVDTAQDKYGNIEDCSYNKESNEITFYDGFHKPVAVCKCKDGWFASKFSDTFGLTESLNDNRVLSISFPLIVSYELEDPSISKDQIVDFDQYEKDCIQQYSDEVISKVEQNIKYINETLGVYDSSLEYDGYDDNFNIFFKLTLKNDEIVDEQIISAYKRYFNKDYQCQFEVEYTRDGEDDQEEGALSTQMILTASPICYQNSKFKIEDID